MDEKERCMGETPQKDVVKDRFPRIVIIILIAEFCERFSYSGMRAFLTLYLRSKLDYTDDGATEIYHLFSTLVYLFPIFGGILADNYLGKYRTIFYMLFVYATGNILVAVTAVPQLALSGRLCTLIGLFLITVGTGGIKPCVMAFGGDQFKLPDQEKHLAIYFSVLYFTLCTGSLIAKAVSPILRSEVSCFGDKDCYSLAFGAPSIIIIISMITFVSAKKSYVLKEPEGNVVFDFIKCVALGVKNAVLKRRISSRSHWLDSTADSFDPAFIRDVKQTLSILTLFTVLPVFWALLDQLGSRWTLQATKMDGRFWLLTVKPDQMQVLVPTFILLIIPTMQKCVYPWLHARGLLRNPLHKLVAGGALAGVAFIASGTLEIYLKTTYPELPRAGYSQLRIFNGHPCPVSLHNDNITYNIAPLQHYSKKDIIITGTANITFELGGDCIEPREQVFTLSEAAAVSYYLTGDKFERYIDHVHKSRSGFPVVRFLVSDNLSNSNMTLYNNKRGEIEANISVGVSQRHEVYTAMYSVTVNDTVVLKDVELESGGVYTIMMDTIGDEYKTEVLVITAPNSITMAWMLPQFLIMAVAEVLFAVSGNEFAFKEAPDSMRAVVSACFLLTEAAGNVVIIVVSRLCVNYQQETQFFIFTAMMFVSIAVFYCMSRGYRFTAEHIPSVAGTRDARKDSVVLYHQVKQVEECTDH
ncbi:peptide transporter family 1 [Plutella xylostella]|uniref:peptide transporter family 1 n=1 Tax=Plutella xylostella TaxID=51655 RepID=UPI00203223F6|nr:peptide transporter family 1 [Plutella xylostella]